MEIAGTPLSQLDLNLFALKDGSFFETMVKLFFS
jgi:hypothetical protein